MIKEHDHFKVTEPYYNGYRLLATLDRYKRKPEVFVSTTNRSAGKTTFFYGRALHRFIQHNEKFILLYRYKYEIADAANGFFGQIGNLFFPGLHMRQESGVKDVFNRLFIGELSDDGNISYQHCGYATSLGAAEQIKKYSSLLADASVIIMDELFPESGKYLPNETYLLESVHTSLARGNGSQVRYLPVILIGNLIDIFNPYYEQFGIVDSLQLETKFYRGDGFVVEQGFNVASAEAHQSSAFARAFSGSEYSSANSEKRYLNTSYQFIDQSVADQGRYVMTIAYAGSLYSVRYNDQGNFYYCGQKPDRHYKLIHAATEADVSDSAIYDPSSTFRKVLRDKMRVNQVKFKNITCRSAVMHYIAGR